MNAQLKKWLGLLLKLLVAFVALYLVFQKISWSEIKEVLLGANYWLLLLGFLFFLFSKLVSAIRLNLFFRYHGLLLSEWINIQLYWLGMFYNLFLPGGISGDGYKVYWLKQHFNAPVKKLLSAVFVDRLSGMALLVFLAAVLLAFIEGPWKWLPWLALSAPMALAGLWVFLHWFFPMYKTLFRPIAAFSFVVQKAQLICVVFILLAFDISDGFVAYLLLFLVSSVAAVIPVSIGGIGIRELCFLYGAQLFDISEPAAVSVSFTFYVMTMLGSFAGIVWVFKGIEKGR